MKKINEETFKNTTETMQKEFDAKLLESKKNIEIRKNEIDQVSRKYNFDFREWGYMAMSSFVRENFHDHFCIRHDKRGIYITNDYA